MRYKEAGRFFGVYINANKEEMFMLLLRESENKLNKMSANMERQGKVGKNVRRGREKGQDKQFAKGCDFYASIFDPKSSRKL